MAKGKRELIIQALGEDFSLSEFKKFLEINLKNAGVKYSDNSMMYFNVAEANVYCVTEEGKQVKITLKS